MWVSDFIFIFSVLDMPSLVRPRMAAPLWGGVMLCLVELYTDSPMTWPIRQWINVYLEMVQGFFIV